MHFMKIRKNGLAIVHKDYSSCNPIQISIYEDKMYIWNDGEMPANLSSTEKLFKKHSSKPFNPKLAEVFFKSGMIEAWGRGFDKIKEACEKYDAPLPEYDINENGIMVLCKACDRHLRILYGEIHPVQSEQDMINAILAYCKEPRSAKEIQQQFGIERLYLRRHYLDRLIKSGKLKMTLPEKPTSRNQKYFSF